MAREVLTVASVVRNSVISELIAGDANGNLVALVQADGNSFINVVSQVFIYVLNTKVGAIAVTVSTNTTVAGLTLPDLEVTIGEDDFAIIGPFTADFHQDSTRLVHVDTDSGATGFIGAYRLQANDD